MDVVIGIDTGTTATKAVAAGLDAELRAHASVHYPLSVPAPGRAELDPDQLRNAAVKAPVRNAPIRRVIFIRPPDDLYSN